MHAHGCRSERAVRKKPLGSKGWQHTCFVEQPIATAAENTVKVSPSVPKPEVSSCGRPSKHATCHRQDTSRNDRRIVCGLQLIAADQVTMSRQTHLPTLVPYDGSAGSMPAGRPHDVLCGHPHAFGRVEAG